MVITFLKQPLLHFLLLGCLLFLVYEWLNSEAEGAMDRIVVDDQALLDYVQYRNRAFNPQAARAYLQALDQDQKAGLVDRLIREEALYREARALRLDANDYVIKQRLVQKIEFLARGVEVMDASFTEADVVSYFETNEQRYREPPRATFAHVFVEADRHGRDSAHQRAVELGKELNGREATFSHATRHGDRFSYHTNYVDRSDEHVASHFGSSFAEEVFALEPREDQWQGPVASVHGYHLVLLVRKRPGGVPPMEEIRAQLEQDARRAWLSERAEQTIAEIIGGYDVEVSISDRPTQDLPLLGVRE